MSINTRTFLVATFSILFTFGAFHTALAATIIPYGTGISADTTWTKANSPYIVNPMGVASGATLTIEPGVVVKFKAGTGIGIGGRLIVGTRGGEPVTITSEFDDNAGGDTNNDGTTTSPMAGDWGYIVFYTDSVGDFNNTNIRYGGRAWDHGYVEEGQIKNTGGVVTIKGGSMTDNNGMSIYGVSGTTTVRETLFARSARGAIYMLGGSLTIGKDTFSELSYEAVHLRGTMNFSNEGGNVMSDGTIGSIGFHYLSLSGVNVLRPDALANHVIGGIGVNPGVVWRLLPGVIIKSDVTANIGVLGTLIAGDNSTDTPVTFTSWQDDSVGGDANSDGAVSVPHYGDWCGVIVYTGGTMNLSHSTLRYGGCVYNFGTVYTYPMVGNTGGTLSITDSKLSDSGNFGVKNDFGTTVILNSLITKNPYGIYHTGGETTIHNSSIHDNYQYGILNITTDTLDATNNWWGTFGGPTYGANPFGTGDKVSNYVNYGAWLDNEPLGTCVVNCNSNVLFLPGMMGSRLFEVSPACGIFNNESERWVSTLDCDQARLALDSNGKSLYPLYTKEGEHGVIDDAYSANLYQSFMHDLNSWKNDEKIIADYALVPYDWRLTLEDILQNGASTTAGTLSYGTSQGFQHSYIYQKLTELAKSSRTGKVTIVAHSNGGLVTKALIQKLKETHDPLYDKIVKVIFVAVPQVGTPEAISNILHGDNIGPLGFVMSTKRLRNLTQNMPGAYHQLPSSAYFSGLGASVDTAVVSFQVGTATAPFISRYGQAINTKVALYDFLLGREGRAAPAYDDLENPTILQQNILDYATDIHQRLDDNWEVSSSTKIYQIAGWGEKTLATVDYRSVRYCERVDSIVIQGRTSHYCGLWGSRLTFDPKKVLDGDGTVVVPSALAMSTSSERVGRWWVDLKRYNADNKIEATPFGRVHKDIFEVPNLRKLIKSIMEKNMILPITYISTSTPLDDANNPRLTFTLHSPLTLEFTDSDGHHVGPSTTTPTGVDGNVPGARYERYGEVQLLSIPRAATGTLTLHGIASGSFTLDVREENGDTILATTSFEGIPSATSTIVTMNLTPTSSPAINGILNLDIDGDGTIDNMLHAQAGGTVTADIKPPEARISFSTSTQQLLTLGIDASPTSVYSTTTSRTIVDGAGNITTIHFATLKEGNRRIKAQIDSLSYNGIVTPVTATLTYKWRTNKQGEYTMFAAYLKTASTTLEVHYRVKKNQTIIMTKPTDLDDADSDDDSEARPIKTKLSGMIIPSIVTSQAKLNITY